jgi:iron complex outermembrane recepter protein
MPNSNHKKPLVIAVLLALPMFAQAQLEEVIVTAQKRAESLQDVPVSVSAISGDLIKEGGITGIGDVAVQTPNFTMTQFNIGEPQYYIRGIGNSADSAGSDPAVATFVDEVYVGRAGGGSSDLFDLDRIEILRGPQGTLFGKNVVGGAISYHTARPTQEFEGKVGVTVGNYDLTVLQGLVSGPLTDGLAGKLVFSKRDRDEGYVENVLDGEEYQDEDNLSVRGQLLWDATDDVQVLIGADYSEDDQAGNCRNVGSLTLNDPLGLAAVYVPVVAATTGNDIRKCASPAKAFQEREVKGLMARVDWDMGFATFTSLTAYRDMEYEHLEDLAGLPAGITPFNLIDTVDEESDQVSQEFRLSSTGDGSLEWLVGAFYMQENVDRAESFIGGFGFPLSSTPGVPLLDGDITFLQDAETTSYAAFGQLSWQFSDQWSLTVGARYSYDEKEITQGLANNEDPAFDTALIAGALGVPNAVVEAVFAPQDAVVLGIPANGFGSLGAFFGSGDPSVFSFPYSVDADDDWSEVTTSASLNWTYSDDGLLYLSFSEGYKSGAFAGQAAFPEAAIVPLEPELATNYEVGIKSEFLDNRLRINASAFYTDYEDLQVFQLVGSLLVSGNAEATSEGIELEVTGLLTDNWTVVANYAYLDAEYDEYILGSNDFAGNSLPRAAEDSYFLRSSYVVPMNSGAELDLVVSYAYTGDFYFAPSAQASSFEEGYGLLDASVNWRSASGAWDITAWGKNLDDEEYRLHMIIGNVAGSVDVWGPPRTYGLTVNYAF